MQPIEAPYAVDSLLRSHSAAIEQMHVLCRSPGRHWIHQQSCEALAFIYKQALQKLTNMLSVLFLSRRLSASQQHLLLQPALDMVLASILQGKRFAESCRLPLSLNLEAISHIRRGLSALSHAKSSVSSAISHSRGMSASSSYSHDNGSEDIAPVLVPYENAIAEVDKYWLQRALLKGHAMDAMDVHLHDFLLAFSAVVSVIKDLNAEYMAQASSTSKIIIDQAPSPDLFWKEQNKPHVLLVSAQRLDYVKHLDETAFNSQIEEAINLRGFSDDGDTTQQQKNIITTMGANFHDAARLAAFVKEKVRYTKQAFQEDLGSSFLDINELEVVRTIEDSFFSTSIYIVMWLGTQFALKVYRKSMEEAFWQEANIHVRLYHPNVVHAVALFKGEQKGYGILMELMDETLDSFLRKHASVLRLHEKVSIMLQIAKGMAYVHERGVIHRDLKPANVLIKSSIDTDVSMSRQLEVKVADFGESRFRLPNSSSFKTKKVGTTVYRAPEVLNENYESFNFTLSYKKSADVYSFAMTCFKLLTEKEPFHDADKRQPLSNRVIIGERPDLKSISDAICPPYLKHCLETWWADDPKTRHSFTYICCILRHLYACLARCHKDTKPLELFPFLGWPSSRWKKAQDIAQERLEQFETRRAEDDWKEKGYLCESTRVNEIPYEMHVMNWAIKKAADDQLDKAIEAVRNPQSLDVTTREIHPENPLPDHSPPESRIGTTQAPTSAAPQPPANRSTSNKSFGQALKEFCCFSPNVTMSNHEAFHKDTCRRS